VYWRGWTCLRSYTLPASPGTWGYHHSTGTNLGAWTSLGIPYGATTSFAVATDVNGDGLMDIVYVGSGASYAPAVYLHSGATVVADLATSFTDGFGFNYSPTYTQLTNSSYYSAGTGAVYPEQNYQGPRTVVASYRVTDASRSGSTYTVSEYYDDARVNMQGRGFEGFSYIRSYDSRNTLYSYNYYSLAFPETGMLAQTALSTSSKPYASVVNTNTYATLDATNRRYFPYVSQSVQSQYELGGALDGTLVTQSTTTYTYAGTNGFTYGNPTQITTTTVDKDPTSPWTGSSFSKTTNITPYELGGAGSTGWCIHLPSQVTDQRSIPGGASLTHTTSYGVNSNSECEVDTQTIEPSSTVDRVTTAFSYTDGCGNANTISVTGQNPDGSTMSARTTILGYGAHCINPETVRNPLSQNSSLGYRYDLGLPTSVTDPNSLTSSWTYNDLAQKTLEQRPDGTQTSYTLTACSSHCSLSGPAMYYSLAQEQDSTSSHTTFRQHYDYRDQLDRAILNKTQIAGGQFADVWSVYDSLGRLNQKSSPYADGGTQYLTTYNYDLLNRLTSESRPISATNSTLEYTYFTYQGRTGTRQDPKGYITTAKTDVLGEVRTVTDPDGVSNTSYAYDPFGHRTQVSDPTGNLTTISYDALGYLPTGSSDPDRGAWTTQLDSLGELLNLRDAKTSAPAWTRQVTYDALGRMTQRVEAEGTSVFTWGTVASNHEIGRLKEMSGLSDDETFTYDSFGRPASQSMRWSGGVYTYNYSYNSLGKLNALTYPLLTGEANPFAVLYNYSNGYVSSVENYTGGVAGTTFWELTPGATNVDPWGHVTDETLGTSAPVRIQSAFDAVTAALNLRTAGSGGSLNNLQSLAYQWDQNLNLSQRQDLIQNLTEAFSYDSLNRLQTSTLNGTTNLTVSDDSTGNITQMVSPGITVPYTYDSTHVHAVHSAGTGTNLRTYTYDANGNMSTSQISGVQYSASWTSANLLASMQFGSTTLASFQYGPDRQRKQQTALYNGSRGDNGTETTIYVGGLLEIETTPAQMHYKHFVQTPSGTRIIYDVQSVSGTQVTYITADHLGSAGLFLNTAGTAILNESYSAYGYRRTSNWTTPLSITASDYSTIASTTRRGFTGGFHETLDNVGLIHMNGRVYDPVIGRFVSPDPMPGQALLSQSWNPYSYVMNRPLTMADPTGQEAQNVDKDGGSADSGGGDSGGGDSGGGDSSGGDSSGGDSSGGDSSGGDSNAGNSASEGYSMEQVVVRGSRENQDPSTAVSTDPQSGPPSRDPDGNGGGGGNPSKAVPPGKQTPPERPCNDPSCTQKVTAPPPLPNWWVWVFYDRNEPAYISVWPSAPDRGDRNTSVPPICYATSRANNGSLHTNMGWGAGAGAVAGIGLGIVIANVVGFPEVEAGELGAGVLLAGRAVQGEIMLIRAAAVDNVTAPASLSLLSGGVFGTMGGAVGFGFTSGACP
jgi:RHS repeat-associated protein